jgi:hypothetical protein
MGTTVAIRCARSETIAAKGGIGPTRITLEKAVSVHSVPG